MPLNSKVIKTAVCDRCGTSLEYDQTNDLAYWKSIESKSIATTHIVFYSILCPTCVQDLRNFMSEKLTT